MPQSPQKRRSAKRPAKKAPVSNGKAQAVARANRRYTVGHLVRSIREAMSHDTASFIVGVILFFITLFIFIACLSYLFTAAHDQSVVRSTKFTAAMFGDGDVSNLLRLRGAYVSDALIDRFLGVGSFLLIPFPFMLSIKLIGITKRIRLLTSFVVCTLSALWVSLFAALVNLPFSDDSYFRWGGLHGEVLRKWLMTNVGITGLILLLLLSFIIIAVLFWPQSKDGFRKAFSLSWTKTPFKKRPRAVQMDSDNEFSESESYTLREEEQDLEDALEEEESPMDRKGAKDSIPDEIPSALAKGKSRLVVEVAKGDELSAQAEIMQPQSESHDLPGYQFPPLDLLDEDGGELAMPDMKEIRANEQLIIERLESFKIKVTPIKATVGPTVTLYEIEPDAGIKISRIRGLEDDIALSLKAEGIRIIAPIPGKGTIGIEVPNKKQDVVHLRGLLSSRKFIENKMELPVAMGKTITNEVFMFDLAKMPHLLIAGATGQGKSVGMNVIITSLLYSKHPSELKFVMIDPKVLEFSIYSVLERHYFAKLPDESKCIITDTDRVIPTLLSLCQEMDRRYKQMTQANVRSISEYNKAFRRGNLLESEGYSLMPYIVLVVDEFADLIMTGGKEIERPIARIAQKARAAGIHMILATQRPTTDVVTGTIKANFPARIAFKVFSAIDSRTILDSTGANRLIGRGDMLFYQGKDMIRLQSAFVDTSETKLIVDFIADQPSYLEAYPLPEPEEPDSDNVRGLSNDKLDPYFEKVARMVVDTGQGSTSKIQREFEIGFNRAGRLMDQLERAGIVGKQNGSKPREVLISDPDTLNQLFYRLRNSQ